MGLVIALKLLASTMRELLASRVTPPNRITFPFFAVISPDPPTLSLSELKLGSLGRSVSTNVAKLISTNLFALP